MLEVRLLGAFQARVDGTPVDLASARAQSLLAYLALQNGAPQRRDRVAYLLWPDSTEQQARTNLRHVLHTLRAAIPDPDRHLTATAQALTLHDFSVDVAARCRAGGRGRRCRTAAEGRRPVHRRPAGRLV